MNSMSEVSASMVDSYIKIEEYDANFSYVTMLQEFAVY